MCHTLQHFHPPNWDFRRGAPSGLVLVTRAMPEFRCDPADLCQSEHLQVTQNRDIPGPKQKPRSASVILDVPVKIGHSGRYGICACVGIANLWVGETQPSEQR